jgi:hypothetical protein
MLLLLSVIFATNGQGLKQLVCAHPVTLLTAAELRYKSYCYIL